VITTEQTSGTKSVSRPQALSQCISVDLEVSKKTERIHAFAGVRCDTKETVVYPDNGRGLQQALADLDALANGAKFLLGHNYINFDQAHLRATNPTLRLLRMPVVDTLWLNPLAFPRNPYHRLVKHYQDGQLITDRKNDPEHDAQIAFQLFVDQQESLAKASPDLLTAWHWLTSATPGNGFDLVFKHLRRLSRPSDAEAHQAILRLFRGVTCRTHADEAIRNVADQGWPLAYALAWLSVSGGNSVMPPWVRHQFPEAGDLVRRLRDQRCADRDCGWCMERHNPCRELTRFFGFDNFRPKPSDANGYPLQQAIVDAAMDGENVLGILPTGTGKSVCYQLPALSRYDKTGSVTVVVSPLVALMADQVTSLERHNITSCVTINSMLTQPERRVALEKLRLGDTAIVLISPEQLRSVSFRTALEQREIGSWVLDEAHCLSKWGHDFRPDYRYVGRYIGRRAEAGVTPPVLCLTATAKPGVKEEIVEYFAKTLDIEMRTFDGGSERTNLDFMVTPTTAATKLHDIHMILREHLPTGNDGGAIVYCATRNRTEEVAEFLHTQGFAADRFHAGLQPEDKKTIQRSFIDGDLKAIAATNAFGMGIDKPDVRLVVHADIPSSLENYLQEAGRAGRDQQQAQCVLLYTQDDVERQFGMSARSQLKRREIYGMLKALRRLSKRNDGNEIVATVGEILIHDEMKEFERESATDDTRGRTALAWLEEAELLRREENRVRIFPSCLRVNSVEEASRKLQKRTVGHTTSQRLLPIVKMLIDADPDQGISTDMVMDNLGLNPDQVRGALQDLEQCGIATNDTALTAFVHVGVVDHSKRRLDEAANAEETLLQHMQEIAPDMQVGDTAPLHLSVASQKVKDAGSKHVRTEHIVRLLQGIASDGRGESIGAGSITMRQQGADTYLITLNHEWSSIVGRAKRRRAAAYRLLDDLLTHAPKGKRGKDLLVETTMGKLNDAVARDLTLARETTNARRLVDRALVWLHEQEAIRLNKGLTVFRPAMTIHMSPEKRGYWQSDFQPLQIHYDETIRQIHVMAEYAQRGLSNMADALHLTIEYFTLGETEFLRRWLPRSDPELLRQTTPESWRRIVEELNNPSQRRLVTDNRENANLLVLAGPGSGKTRVLVHRIAYLLRVKRENPRGILALAFNRHAAVEIRSRLAALVGDDSRRVMVLTYHALAMRLVGSSFSARVDNPKSDDFRAILKEATALLRGDGLDADDAEESRARLLAGFRWILVDEYQDVGQEEYDLIAALTGRTLADDDSKLTLFAVGDDDQNIYSFKGSSVKFIRSFEQDYKAQPAYLINNYRSTGHIIAAANAVIEPAQNRMKENHKIRIEKQRQKDSCGGVWTQLDPVSRGRVQILHVKGTYISQAQTAVAELQRLKELSPVWDWSNCAVLAREWKYLEPIQSICEREDIPVQNASEDLPSVWHLRETQSLLDWLSNHNRRQILNADLQKWLARQNQDPNPWMELLGEAIAAHAIEAGDAEVPVDSFREWLAEWGRETRRQQRGLLLSTAHRAKGLEFDHVVVLDGGWERTSREDDPDASRRLYYVSMTRARHTLTLMHFGQPNRFHSVLKGHPSVMHRGVLTPPPAAPELQRRYQSLSLKDVDIDFSGRQPLRDPVHTAIKALSPKDPLTLRLQSGNWVLLDHLGTTVGKLAKKFRPPQEMVCTRASVRAIIVRFHRQSRPEFQGRLRCEESWEVVLPELIFEPEAGQDQAGQDQAVQDQAVQASPLRSRSSL